MTDDDTNHSDTNNHDILYYDGSCPLCDKEIAWLKKYQRGQLAFKNIHTLEDKDLKTNINKQSMLKKLHLRQATGKWVFGLDATVASWSHTPFGFILSPLRWPIIRGLADSAYNHWASKRYRKRYLCNACHSPK